MEEEKKPVVEQPQDDHMGLITEANKAAERIEQANKEMKSLLDKQELLLAEQRLHGRSYAGGIEQKKVLTPMELADECFKGKFNPLKIE